MKLEMTYELAYAIGWDAANRQMRRDGRTKWNEDDLTLAAQIMNDLLGDPTKPPYQVRGQLCQVAP